MLQLKSSLLNSLGLMLTAAALCAGMMVSLHAASANPADFDCTAYDGSWDEGSATCTLDEDWSWSINEIPAGVTVVVSGTFFTQPMIIGPGPGVMYVEDVTIDGELVIANEAINYAPVEVNGRLVISGTWGNYEESRYACDEIRDICAASSVEGYISNHGILTSDGAASMPFGLTNAGEWQNGGSVNIGGTVVNSGRLTNTGIISITGVMQNSGASFHPGLLVNQGEIINGGSLTGNIRNEGVIISTGILSATIEGSGSVHILDEQFYLPTVQQ